MGISTPLIGILLGVFTVGFTRLISFKSLSCSSCSSRNIFDYEMNPFLEFYLTTLIFSDIEGSWGYWSVAFFQQVASLGNNIAIQIAAGTSLKVET